MDNKLKILIANRGEISRRIGQTCRQLGISTVSVYTPGEENLPHVWESDESYSLGKGTLGETYLNGEKIIALAKECGAKAIHPGYGFLSENGDFAQSVRDAGLIFIGPSSASMKLMGDKKAAKEMAKKLGIPLLAGYQGEHLKEQAKRIGYPLLIKASKGGGGKGMRLVSREKDFSSALAQARGEARAAFGDETVLLEKYIPSPRHIEVQIMGDSKGNYLHFFERECSLQRRYQKIIEESPAPKLDEKLRQKLCQDALKIARSIKYQNAGTVEFILDGKGQYFFLEMNTRLQVEHPVTEMVLGLDLVALQIEVALGQSLPLVQEEIVPHGHAIEARLCAEEGENNFFPSSGTIHYMGSPWPNFVRADSGYKRGNFVGVEFDSLLAKVIAWGKTRQQATERLIHALRQSSVVGLKTNREYLLRLLEHPSFGQGELSTSFIADYEEDLNSTTPLTREEKSLAIGAFLLSSSPSKASFSDSWDHLTNFSNV